MNILANRQDPIKCEHQSRKYPEKVKEMSHCPQEILSKY
jgi:hypothetical protein